MFELVCVKPKGGLTIDKTYKAISHFSRGVVVYNDKGEWISYKLNTFKPVEVVRTNLFGEPETVIRAVCKNGLNEPLKLEAGYYGANVHTLGAYDYRGYDIVIDGTDHDMPLKGSKFRIGIYNAGEHEAIELGTFDDFNLHDVQRYVDQMINRLKRC